MVERVRAHVVRKCQRFLNLFVNCLGFYMPWWWISQPIKLRDIIKIMLREMYFQRSPHNWLMCSPSFRSILWDRISLLNNYLWKYIITVTSLDNNNCMNNIFFKKSTLWQFQRVGGSPIEIKTKIRYLIICFVVIIFP